MVVGIWSLDQAKVNKNDQAQVMELEQGATSGCSRQKVYDRTFLFCIQDTIEGVDDIGYIAVLGRGEFSLQLSPTCASRCHSLIICIWIERIIFALYA
jgi:hypothetical protein